ncbi:BTAD domain-containing putative transcriptional regulator [Steroidobacter cummioxidans]|uniref:BTAD domain-containing putative transcriptional regulator n=1 Tax=Steroidobacter cummioxidans TaxID=1803913 RepID=UPI000E30E069|nr:BTAD domain-containing putative transcriptional regulator [Steroidobacter cummioxidans]
MSALTLQVLGSFHVRDASGGEVRIASRKGRALLAYLALRPGESHSRDRLAHLLWEDADEELARTSLRQALAALRKSLPTAAQTALLADTDSVGIDAGLLQSDIAAFRDALLAGTRTALQDAISHYRGDLLDGFDARSTAFDEWLSSERSALRKQMGDTLQRLTDLCMAAKDNDGALTACTKLVSLEPLNEAAHRRIMELQAKRNSYAEALRQYRVCRDVLRRELDVSPEAATEQLYRELMRKRRAAVAGAADSEPFIDQAVDAAPAPAARQELRPSLRDATIFVARLEGLLETEARLDPEEAQLLSNEFQRRVQSAVQEFGGLTDRRVGSNVMAVFGIPHSYGNENERAGRAASMLRDVVNAKPWPVPCKLALRIGIAQGQVLCGSEVFPLSGRPTHEAHTLAAQARDGEVLISEDMRALNAIGADGATATQPFVGRRPELAMILASLDRCMSSRHGRAIIVRGEAGIGKTRLVDTVRSAAVERGVGVHSAQIFDFGQSPGRRPITTLALSLLGIHTDAPAAERKAAAQRMAALRRGSIDQIIFLSDLINAPLEPELAALEKAMEVATRQRGRTLALAQIIEAAAQRSPQLLVVEDVHWADTDELARLGEIAAVVANCQILFIMTTRPEGDPISASWRARARGCPVTTVDLAPLAEDEAQELAAHYPALSSETIQECIVRADGYPLFLDQLLRSASTGQHTLPGSVRSLVLSRADSLSEQDHRALEAAAVLGQRTELAVVRRMLEDDSYEPANLIATALVRSDGIDLEFAHALFRDAIYESTLKSQRRALHRVASEWFASRDLSLHAEHLAAADDDNAAEAYIKAAEAERTALRYERALNLANKASAVAREPMMLHRTSMLLGELLLHLGRTHDALAAYREALDFAIEQTGHGTAWLGVASALRVMDRHEEALDALERAQTLFGETADAQTRARMSTLHGNLCFPLGRFDACLQAHQTAYQYAQQANSPPELARALGGLGDAHYQRGNLLTARQHFVQCVKEAREHGLISVLLANLPMVGITHVYCGEVAAGRASLQECREIARRVGDLRSEMISVLCLTSGLILQGKHEERSQLARQAMRMAKQLGARRFHAECLGILASCMTAPESRDEALRLVAEGLQLSRELGMSYCGASLLGILARLTPDPAQRAAALAEGETVLASGCVSHSYFEFYHHAMEVSIEQSAWQAARRYANDLSTYTAAEPLAPTDLQSARARLLADVGENIITPQTIFELETLKQRCQTMEAVALIPAVDAAITLVSRPPTA